MALWQALESYFHARDMDDPLMMEQSIRDLEFWAKLQQMREYRQEVTRQ